ncbi:MAG: transaldolase family protein [Patescibacteria group bacterium]|nr:transaldolase family protein [Patescibacteria group bacterium]
MKKLNISSKIFVDGGDPKETREAKELLGFVHGQTTNPTLISQNPIVRERMERGEKFSKREAYHFYQEVVREIAKIISGPISVEVYADRDTKAQKMIEEAKEMVKWIPNACIKLPITKEGLKAANLAVKENIPLNMTLCFSQEQAAAVYAATKGAENPVFISPFVGRLDDRGENGMNLVENILRMYRNGDGHVNVLTASVRNLNHLLFALSLSCPLITVPFRVIKEWAEKDFILPDENFNYQPQNLKPIPYQEISLDKDWKSYNIYHQLTEIGIEKFVLDWQSMIKS